MDDETETDEHTDAQDDAWRPEDKAAAAAARNPREFDRGVEASDD